MRNGHFYPWNTVLRARHFRRHMRKLPRWYAVWVIYVNGRAKMTARCPLVVLLHVAAVGTGLGWVFLGLTHRSYGSCWRDRSLKPCLNPMNRPGMKPRAIPLASTTSINPTIWISWHPEQLTTPPILFFLGGSKKASPQY